MHRESAINSLIFQGYSRPDWNYFSYNQNDHYICSSLFRMSKIIILYYFLRAYDFDKILLIQGGVLWLVFFILYMYEHIVLQVQLVCAAEKTFISSFRLNHFLFRQFINMFSIIYFISLEGISSGPLTKRVNSFCG